MTVHTVLNTVDVVFVNMIVQKWVFVRMTKYLIKVTNHTENSIGILCTVCTLVALINLLKWTWTFLIFIFRLMKSLVKNCSS